MKKLESVDSYLNGKKIIFLGSSVTYGSASRGKSFVDFLVEQDGITAVKEAVPGTTLVDDEGSSYISRMKKINKEITVDAFVCQLSTNDAANNKPLGRISQTADISSFDTHTIAGAIEYIIAYVRKTWGCPVIFYTNTKYHSKSYAEMVSLLLKIQTKWKIGVIDLWNNDKMSSINKISRRRYMRDSVHPTEAGYRDWWLPVIRSYIIGYIK